MMNVRKYILFFNGTNFQIFKYAFREFRRLQFQSWFIGRSRHLGLCEAAHSQTSGQKIFEHTIFF